MSRAIIVGMLVTGLAAACSKPEEEPRVSHSLSIAVNQYSVETNRVANVSYGLDRDAVVEAVLAKWPDEDLIPSKSESDAGSSSAVFQHGEYLFWDNHLIGLKQDGAFVGLDSGVNITEQDGEYIRELVENIPGGLCGVLGVALSREKLAGKQFESILRDVGLDYWIIGEMNVVDVPKDRNGKPYGYRISFPDSGLEMVAVLDMLPNAISAENKEYFIESISIAIDEKLDVWKWKTRKDALQNLGRPDYIGGKFYPFLDYALEDCRMRLIFNVEDTTIRRLAFVRKLNSEEEVELEERF